MKAIWLKDRKLKIKREIEELFFKSNTVSIDDMHKFEQNEMKKKRSIKNTLYDWLINYFPEPIRKTILEIKWFDFVRQTKLNPKWEI